MIGRIVGRSFNGFFSTINRFAPWYRLPFPLAVLNLVAVRNVLRQRNLHDTEALAEASEAPPQHFLSARTADGTFNDLKYPAMGRVEARFARNVPLKNAYPEQEPALLTPNPRTVSRELLTRNAFIPASTLNLLAAAWIQFMVHDWFNHGSSEESNPWVLTLPDDDYPIHIHRTRRDPSRSEADAALPPTYANASGHWWDGSQIYGNSIEIQAKLRSGEGGKLIVGRDGLLPTDEAGIDITGFAENWWLGLSLFHTLFVLEHNAICGRLRAAYPSWSDDDLYEHARLINAALMAKIHTVEWTPAILNHPVLRVGMRANWWGAVGETLYQRFGRISSSEVISGIPGSPTAHHSGMYAMTEEFTAVYRMHPLLPDEFRFRSAAEQTALRERTFPELAFKNARVRLQEMSMADVIYSFGTSHPGAITLHNFPRFLQKLEKPDGTVQDVAATDILRDRERGVPRYNEFRTLVHKPPVRSFDQLTKNKEWAEELARVYGNDIGRVDLMVGLYAESPPRGFGFSDTAFRIFVLMASRRLKSDRFFTTAYTPAVYTPEGMSWIDDNTMSTVLIRHYPILEEPLRHMKNAFAPWPGTSA